MVYLENSLLEQDVWISRPVTNGNITSSPFITEAELEEALADYPTTEEVEAMVSGAVNTGLVQTMIDDSLVPYWTSAQTNSAITDATSAFTTTGDVADMISAFTTTGDVQTQIDLSLLPYWTSAQTNSAITDATSAFTTSGDVEDMMHYRIVDDLTEIENPEHGDMATLRGRAGFYYSIGTSNPFGSIDNVEILQFTYNGTTYHIYTYETDDVFGFYSYDLLGNVEYPVIDKHNGKLAEGVQMSGLIGSWVIGETYPLEFKITNYGATYFTVEFGSISSALSATNVFQSSAFLPELDKIFEDDITYYPMYPYFYDGSKWVYNPQEFITKGEMGQFPTYGEVEAMITAATTAFTTTAQVQTQIEDAISSISQNYIITDYLSSIDDPYEGLMVFATEEEGPYGGSYIATFKKSTSPYQYFLHYSPSNYAGVIETPENQGLIRVCWDDVMEFDGAEPGTVVTRTDGNVTITMTYLGTEESEDHEDWVSYLIQFQGAESTTSEDFTDVRVTSGGTGGLFVYTNTMWNPVGGGGSTDLSDYWTSAQTMGWVNDQHYLTEHQSLSAYSTTDEVENMITSATSAFTTTGDVSDMISAFTTTGDVQTQIGLSLIPYWTSAQTNSAITSATSGMATEQWVQNQGYLTEHQSLSAYSTTDEVENMITAATSGFTTSGDVNTQIGTSLIPYWTSAQTNSAITSATENMATTGTVENMITAATSAFTTSAQVQSQITSALTGYNPTDNFKTINNNSIIGTGDITIQGGGSNVSWNQITTAGTKIAEVTINSAITDVYAPNGGGGGEQVVELTQAQYLALTAYSENTTYVITDADYIDMDQYYTSGETNAAIQAATSGKQDSITTTANSSNRNFPLWNANGQITGKTGNNVSSVGFSVNGSNQTGILRDNSSSNLTGIYAPTAVGSNGNLLRSTGSGAPSWASPSTLNLVESTTLRNIVICSQTDYDNMQSHDSATIYIIND